MDPPRFIHALSDYPVNSINFMVEAAGIEPASEDIATRTSTSLVYNLILALTSLIDKVRIGQSAKVSSV
jgi:hypothetical protein